MPTKADLTTDIQNSGRWRDLVGPALIEEKEGGKFRKYGFTGIRDVDKTPGTVELVVKAMWVIDEGTGTEDAGWISEDPTVQPAQYKIIQAIENRIANAGNTLIGMVPNSLRFDADLMSATFTGIEESAADATLVEYSLTVDRGTGTPSLRKIV